MNLAGGDIMGLINVENKIITASMLMELFQKVRYTYDSFLSVSEREKAANAKLAEENQRWTFLDKGSECNASVLFLSGDDKRYQSISEFISDYGKRGGEMSQIILRIALFYQVTDGSGKKVSYDERISLTITERDIDISVNLGTQKKLGALYSEIVNLLNSGKVRYDAVIKRRGLYIRLIHNTVPFIIAAVVGLIFFVFSLIDAESVVVSFAIVGSLALFIGIIVLMFWGAFKLANRPKTDEEKRIAAQNKRVKARNEAAEQEQYEKFAREYGGYYFTRFRNTIYPYRILKYYNEIMPAKLRTTVKGLRVKNQWDTENFVKKGEISVGEGVTKEECRRAIEKRIKVAGIALLAGVVLWILTVLIVIMFGM